MEGNLESRDYSERKSVKEILREAERDLERREEIRARVAEILERYEEERLERTSKNIERTDSPSTSVENIEKTLKHHQHIHRGTKSWHYDEYDTYKKAMLEPSEMSCSEIAERHDLDKEKIEAWREGRDTPSIPRRLEVFERARIEHEGNVPEEALTHRMESGKVREVLEEYIDQENLSVEDLTNLTRRIYEIEDVKKDSVTYAELYDTNEPLTEDKFRDLGLEIRARRETIESGLNEQLGLDKDPLREVRVAVTDSRLYY